MVPLLELPPDGVGLLPHATATKATSAATVSSEKVLVLRIMRSPPRAGLALRPMETPVAPTLIHRRASCDLESGRAAELGRHLETDALRHQEALARREQDLGRERQELDADELGQVTVPHAAGRVLDVGIDLTERDVAVGHHRRDGQRGQRDHDRQVAQAEGLERDDEDAERRHGAADVGDVDGEGAEASVVAERDAEGEGERRADRQGFGRKLQVLGQAGRDAVGALPVGAVRKPGPYRGGDAHRDLAQGSARRWPPASARSANRASAIESAVATTRGEWKLSWRPWLISCPSPPRPITAVMVINPIVETVATRRPAKIDGRASGISTRRSRARGR